MRRRTTPYNRFDAVALGAVIALVLAYTQCVTVRYAISSRPSTATVTKLTQKNVAGGTTWLVEYHFTDTGSHTRADCVPAVICERSEVVNLAPGQPVPAIGDTINIEYIPGELGASRLPLQRHNQLILIVMVALFLIAAVSILRRNKYVDFQPTWNLP